MDNQQMYRVVNPNKDLEFEKQPIKSPEERQYLVCIATISGDVNEWEICIGRTEAYEYIKDAIENYQVDFNFSFVLVETCKLSDRKSLYRFMKHAEQFYPEDNFDIEDHIKGDWSENDYIKNNNIDDMFVNNANSVSMEDMMNGNIAIKSLD